MADAVAQPADTPSYQWAPDEIPGFFYPANGGGDDDLPGTAFQRYRDISNDTWQNYLGAVGRQGGYGTTTFAAGTAVAIKAGSIFEGMDPATMPLTIDSGSGNDPNQDVNGTNQPRAKLPTRLCNWSGITANEPLRQERVELDLAGADHPDGRRRALHGRHGHVRLRPRAGPGRDAQRAGQARHGPPAADDGRTPRRRTPSGSSTRPPTATWRPRVTRWRST